MSTTISARPGVSLDQVMDALSAELGGRYTIDRGGKADRFTVKGGLLTTAHVKVHGEGRATAIVVSGGGGILVSQRVRNEHGIARDVVAALERSPLLASGGR